MYKRQTFYGASDKFDAAAVEYRSGLVYGPETVSYTHLDVYKRQEITTAEQRQKSFTGMMKVARGAEY